MFVHVQKLSPNMSSFYCNGKEEFEGGLILRYCRGGWGILVVVVNLFCIISLHMATWYNFIFQAYILGLLQVQGMLHSSDNRIRVVVSALAGLRFYPCLWRGKVSVSGHNFLSVICRDETK